MVQAPLSPPSEHDQSSWPKPVPLDSPDRTTPIHPLLPGVRVPENPLPSYQYHPVSCLPIDVEEVRTQLRQLRRDFGTFQSALRAQEQAAREAKQKIEASETKREEVQRAIDKKIKERNTELKVLSKYTEKKTSGEPS